jgi:hypothetical protein
VVDVAQKINPAGVLFYSFWEFRLLA